MNEFGPVEAFKGMKKFSPFICILFSLIFFVFKNTAGGVNGGHHQWVDEFAQQHEQHLHEQWCVCFSILI